MTIESDCKFYKDIRYFFSTLKFTDNFKCIIEPETLVYYKADSNQEHIILSKERESIYELDIKSAFPTICRHMFPSSSNFIKKLDELQDNKLERNKHIAITLKGTSEIHQLNEIAKMIITSCVFLNDPNSIILELKKDGIVYIGMRPNLENLNKFTELNFNFNITEYQKYIRYSKTSVFFDSNNELKLKGIYADRPKFIEEQLKLYFLENRLDEETIKQIYLSNLPLKLIIKNRLDEMFLYYFGCDNSKYLNPYGKYELIKSMNEIKIRPNLYLKYFLYPCLHI